MARWFLLVDHALLVAACVYGAATATNPGDAESAWLPLVLFAGVCAGLLFKSRWVVIVPAAFVALIAAFMAFIFMLAILWPEGQVWKLVTGCVVLAALEVATAVYAWSAFGKETPPGKPDKASPESGPAGTAG